MPTQVDFPQRGASFFSVLIGAGLVVVISVASLVLWTEQFFHSGPRGLPENALSLDAAICALLTGGAILAICLHHRKLSFYYGIISLLFATLFLLQSFFYPDWFISDLFTSQRISYLNSYLARMMPAAAIAFILNAITIIFISLKSRIHKLVVIGSIISLSSIAITVIGFYCSTILDGPTFGWLAWLRIPPSLAICLGLIGYCLVLMGWTVFNRRETTIRELLGVIEGVAGVCISLLVITTSLLGLFTWYNSYQNHLQRRLAQMLQSKAALVEQYLGRIKDAADQIASRPIETAGTSALSLSEHRERERRALVSALSATPSLLGITRIDLLHRTSVSVGMPVPGLLKSGSSLRAAAQGVTFPYMTSNGGALVMKTPRTNYRGQYVGADFLVVSFDPLRRLLADQEVLGKTGRLFMGTTRRGRISLIEISKNSPTVFALNKLGSDVSTVLPVMRKALRHRSGVANMAHDNADEGSALGFYLPVKASNWGLVLTMKTQEFWSRIEKEFIEVLTATMLLAIVGTALFSVLIRTFFGQIFNLEDRSIRTRATLEDELKLRKQAEQISFTKEVELEVILENAVHGILALDSQGTILSVNRAAKELFGYKSEEIEGKQLKVLLPSIDGNGLIPSTNGNGHGSPRELIGVKKDGTEFPLEFSIGVINVADRMLFTAGVYDLTERKQSRRKLEDSLQEKEILLKEIHHRVKNNLQVISSIFSLQRRRTTDQVLVSLLEESQWRVQSIALLHDTLHRSRNLSQIDMGDYLARLADYHTRSLGRVDGEEPISAKVEAKGVFLDLDKAMPCGLIINELITNSIKHGYPPKLDRKPKEIAVVLLQNQDHSVQLRVSDNGIGIPPALLNNNSSGSLGLNLVRTLCQQLNGSMDVAVEKGTTFSFLFH